MDVTDHPNARALGEAFQRLGEGDVPGWLSVFDESLRFHFLHALPAVTGTYEGRDAWLQGLIVPMMTVTSGSFTSRPVWLRDAGEDAVVGHFDNRFTLDGVSSRADVVIVHRFRDGRVVEVWDLAFLVDQALRERLDAALAGLRAA